MPDAHVLWRISEFTSLDGRGGLVSEGRWHHQGKPIVYAAEGSALAILESLIRIGRIGLPQPYQLLRIEVPGAGSVTRWDGDIASDLATSRDWGSLWLEGGSSALASVPSAVAPHARNVLINPAHPDATSIRVTDASRWPWDKRLFR